MSERIEPQPLDPQQRRLRRSWWLFVASFLVLGAVVVARIAGEAPNAIDLVMAAQVVVMGYAAVLHRNAVHSLEVGRRGEVESLARILQGLSRSMSPDAIVDAIVEELGRGAGADHLVVVRRRPETNVLEARLVSSRPGVPSSTTLFPLSDLEDRPEPERLDRAPVAVPIGEPRVVARTASAREGSRAVVAAERPITTLVRDAASTAPARLRSGLERLGDLTASPASGAPPVAPLASAAPASGARHRIAAPQAARARDVYALRNTVAAPLETEEGVVGAIVLARRLAEPWPPSAHRLLAGAAAEASAALTRATQHRDAETRATTDALTGLPNRRYFEEFTGLLARRRRADDAVGVLLIDVDRFKQVNDTWGHAAGDGVLRAVASAITGAVREGDVPVRFGGEEFAVLLRNPTLEVAVEVGERVRVAVSRLELRALGPTTVTVSVGAAVATMPDQPIGDLVEAADRALYEAKRTGRDRVVAAA